MDHLVEDMSGESIQHLGKLVVAKLMQIGCKDERRDIVNKIVDALYAPWVPKNQKIERLVGFLYDMYDGLDEETSRTMTFQIQKTCMDIRTKIYKPNNNIANIENVTSKNDVTAFVGESMMNNEPKWTNKDKKRGKKIKILIGTHYGLITHVEEIVHDIVTIKLMNGKIAKYSLKHVQFIE